MNASEDFIVDFPSLFVAIDWVQNHLVVPDGYQKGEPLILTDWQAWCLLNHYRIRPTATVGQLAPAFHYRRSQIILVQKSGKSPLGAAFAIMEGLGPVVFAGFAQGHETYKCSDHGCHCGWEYQYSAGEPMAKPWPTPLIQLTAVSEDQVANTFDALKPMVLGGPLASMIKVTEEFVRLPNDGRIDVVSSNARSRLGQRVTAVLMDETGLWTPETRMVKVADTQRRGLAGMGGRAMELSNAWDPAENSVAQRTAEAKATDIFRYHPLPPANLSYSNKRERRKIHKYLYAGSPWVDIDAIDAEAAEIYETDPAQAERFHGNRVTAGTGMAYNPKVWDELIDIEHEVPRNATIVIGVDGARYEDALAVVATEVETGHQWPLGIWEVPTFADNEYEHDFDAVDGVMQETFKFYNVWRVYIDPQRIEKLVERWQGRWGDKTIIEWHTNRPKQMAHAVRKHIEAVNSGDLTHDGDATFRTHIANAVKQPVGVYDDDHRRMFVIKKDRPHSPLKMDAAVAAVIAWEAKGDCTAAGATKPQQRAQLHFL